MRTYPKERTRPRSVKKLILSDQTTNLIQSYHFFNSLPELNWVGF